MPIPLIPVVAALAAGGTLVPHAAGGMIVTAAAGGGYVTGTYLSTAAISGLFVGGLAVLGTGTAVVTGAASAIVGSAGIYGTTIGATGITGALMSAGILSATPIWVPFAIGGGALGIIVGAYKIFKLKRKLKKTPANQEAHFTDSEARAVERVIRLGVRYNGLKLEA